MPLLFFDTSALAKYYSWEPGSDFVEKLFADAGAQRLISRLTMVEMESVFGTMLRTARIEREAALIARRGSDLM